MPFLLFGLVHFPITTPKDQGDKIPRMIMLAFIVTIDEDVQIDSE